MTMLTLAGPFSVLTEAKFWLHDALTLTDDHASCMTVAALSESDRHRYLRYRTAAKRQQFLVSRAVLNAVLNSVPQWSERCRVSRSSHGRPLILNDHDEEAFSVSLSHSGSVTAVAIAPVNRRVGIDVEVWTSLSVSTLASAILRRDEKTWCQTLPHAQMEETLRQIWTAKESVWKCHAADCHTRLQDVRVNQNGTVLITRNCDGTTGHPTAGSDAHAVTMFSNAERELFSNSLRLSGLAELPTPFCGAIAMSVCSGLGDRHRRNGTSPPDETAPYRTDVKREA